MKRIALITAICAFVAVPASADLVYVMGNSHTMVTNARNNLTALGHTVTFGGGTALTDYSGYDQVWDLRYNVNLGAADATAMGNFMAGGGRMYLTGEHNGFDGSRNTSLQNFIGAVGAGPVTLTGSTGSVNQSITAAGQIVNSPNTFSSVRYNAARVISTSGQGFVVTETAAGTNQGSLIGWDFGDIVGSPSARMLVGFDIEIFNSTNGQDWTENMATYLGAPVPVPGAVLLGMLGLSVAGVKLRKRG